MNSMLFQDRTVIFVDDDARWLRVIEKWFEDVNYHCRFFSSVLDALNFIASQEVDVVVSDLRMPILSGSEFMKEVKTKRPQAVRIAMSGTLDFGNSLEAINKGQVHRYIVKPCGNKELKLAVYDALKSIERELKRQDRQKEIRIKNAQRIKSMAKSIRTMEQVLSSAQEGIISVIQRLVFQSEPETEIGDAVRSTIRRFIFQLGIKPEYSKQLELASLFAETCFDMKNAVSFNDQGDFVTHLPRVKEREMLEKATGILDELGFDLAVEILENLGSDKDLNSQVSTDSDLSYELGVCLVRLAHDIATLIIDHDISADAAVKLILRHSHLYGTSLVYDLQLCDINFDGLTQS